MSACIKIVCSSALHKQKMLGEIQDLARELTLEGFIINQGGEVKIIACGSKVDLELFTDKVFTIFAHFEFADLQVDPFLKDKDYRGVFRIIA